MALAKEYSSHFNETLKSVEELTQEFVSRHFGKLIQVYISFWDPGQEWPEQKYSDPWLAAIRGFVLHPRQGRGMSIWMCRCDYNMFPRFPVMFIVLTLWSVSVMCSTMCGAMWRFFYLAVFMSASLSKVLPGRSVCEHLCGSGCDRHVPFTCSRFSYHSVDVPQLRLSDLQSQAKAKKNSFVDRPFDWLGHLTLSSWAKASCCIHGRRTLGFQCRHRCRKQVSVSQTR